MKTLQVLGLMSGTSLDGLDICWCTFLPPSEHHPLGEVHLKAFETLPLPDHLKQQILRQMTPEHSDVAGLCDLNFAWSHYAATAMAQFLTTHKLQFSAIDLIGSHGQTLFHQPPQPDAARRGSTLQLGDGGVLAALTGVTTVTQFRTADMALGGQGAPLVPFLDRLLFQSGQESRILLNIGGMANLSYLPRSGETLAFDTGPGNVLLDVAAQVLTGEPHDWDGQLALQGRVHKALRDEILSHPFFDQTPPRSTGREIFGEAYARHWVEGWQSQGISTPDILATLTAVTVDSIVQACERFLPAPADALYISGGGVHNQALWQGLQQGLPGVKIESLQALGGDPDAKEALAFAALAVACLRGLPANVPSVTGALQPVVLGQIAPGQNWKRLWSQ